MILVTNRLVSLTLNTRYGPDKAATDVAKGWKHN